ncbi:MAG: tetratricopeptide repeat protein [Proteobacteria bacterium]|nr:tetratricopeptide repeat protein [Pseudomonadota bacterium]
MMPAVFNSIGNRMTPSEILISACDSISRQSGAARIETWVKASSLFCEVSGNPLGDFLHAEQILNENGQSAVDIISSIAASSFEWEQEKKTFAAILRMTNLTGLTALRFTSAWLAFNMDQFEICIQECEKIDDHGYHVHGLMGQAYLESGQPHQAIESLRVAIALNERDAALWFQLAKAAFVIGQYDDAWQALQSCTLINGLGPEVVILHCAIACTICESNPSAGSQRRSEAVAGVREIFAADPNKSLLVVYAAKLALFAKSEADFIDEMAWFHDTSGKLQNEIVTADISDVLKSLQKKGWYRGAAALLGVLTGQGHSRSSPGPADPASA